MRLNIHYSKVLYAHSQRSAVKQHHDPLGFPILLFPPLSPVTWLIILGDLQLSLEANGAASNPLSKVSDAIDGSVSTKAFRRRITDNIIIIVFKNVDITFCL